MIALLTDFGLTDVYVGVMKGVMAGLAPGVPLIDVTHGVPPQDVRVGALLLDAAWPYFSPGTVFVCVVDPGVGTRRRPVVVRTADRLFVGPDNGLFTLLPPGETREIAADWGLPGRSRTFHGRDVFAPVAAQLATGRPFVEVGPRVPDPVRIPIPTEHDGVGEVLYADRYGNAVTSLHGRDAGWLHVGALGPLRVVTAYGEAERGEAIALTGSTGRLEIAVRDGDAAGTLHLGPGVPVRWTP